MQYMHVAEFHVHTGAMETFTSAVQRWERAALADPDGPLEHQVLIDSDHPSRVLVLTRFQDEAHARRFASSDLPGRLMADVLSCCETTMSSRRYTVFYAAGRDGHTAIFGREPKSP
jgi:heme-degrading monooxygenase HmoA